MNPRATIAVPTVGRPDFLRRALESVVAQTFADWEAIVVDEGGLDATQEVVESFQDDRIVLYRQPGRVGVVENWGTGVRRARGEFVAILADDDQLHADFLANRLRLLADRTDLLVAFSSFEIRRLDGSLIEVRDAWNGADRELDGDRLLEAALSRRWFIGASLYRRDFVAKLWPQLDRDELVLDLGLNIRLALTEHARGVVLAACDFTMTQHPDQSSEASRGDVRVQTADLLYRLEIEQVDDRRSALLRMERASWLTAWGRELAAAGELQSARRLFARAITICPRSVWAWRQLAVSLLAPGRFRSRLN